MHGKLQKRKKKTKIGVGPKNYGTNQDFRTHDPRSGVTMSPSIKVIFFATTIVSHTSPTCFFKPFAVTGKVTFNQRGENRESQAGLSSIFI